jgi:hypothetical protein
MKSDNELIAEFMRNEAINSPHIIKPEYHTSWDLIMPVVAKIDKLYHKAFPPNDEFINKILDHEWPIDDQYINVVALPLSSTIDEAYAAVVNFINWYNEHNHD